MLLFQEWILFSEIEKELQGGGTDFQRKKAKAEGGQKM
jgi:hypothetical protein